jgi:hypothetical protein
MDYRDYLIRQQQQRMRQQFDALSRRTKIAPGAGFKA